MFTCIVQCCDSASMRNPKLNFFPLPKDVKLRERWIRALQVDKQNITEHLRVCSLHFRAKDFCVGKKALKSRAAPALKLQRPRVKREIIKEKSDSESDSEIVEVKKDVVELSKIPIVRVKLEPLNLDLIKKETSSPPPAPVKEQEICRRSTRHAAQVATKKITDSFHELNSESLRRRPQQTKTQQAKLQPSRTKRTKTEQTKGQPSKTEQIKTEQLIESLQIKLPQIEPLQIRLPQLEIQPIKTRQSKSQQVKQQTETKELVLQQTETKQVKPQQIKTKHIKLQQNETKKIEPQQTKTKQIDSQQTEIKQIKSQETETKQIKLQQSETKQMKSKQGKTMSSNPKQDKTTQMEPQRDETEQIEPEQSPKIQQNIKADNSPKSSVKKMRDQKERRSVCVPDENIDLNMECYEELLSLEQAEALLKSQLHHNMVNKTLKMLHASNVKITYLSVEEAWPEFFPNYTPKVPSIELPVDNTILKENLPNRGPNIITLTPATPVKTVIPIQLTIAATHPMNLVAPDSSADNFIVPHLL